MDTRTYIPNQLVSVSLALYSRLHRVNERTRRIGIVGLARAGKSFDRVAIDANLDHHCDSLSRTNIAPDMSKSVDALIVVFCHTHFESSESCVWQH